MSLLSLRLLLPLLLTLTAATAGADSAAPKTLWDGTGTGGVRVPGAETTPRRGAATLSGSYFAQNNLLHPDDAASRSTYGLAALYAPLDGIDPLGLELGVRMAGASVFNSRGNPERLDASGDWLLAAKGTYAVNESLRTGARLELRLPSGVDGSSGYGDTASYAAQWVSTWRSGQLALHALAGFLYDRTVNFTRGAPTEVERFAWGQRDFNQVVYGLSVNYELDRVAWIGEISGEVPVGERAPAFSASPLRLTPGVRFRATEEIELQLAANFALAGTRSPGMAAEPGYDVLAGVRWLFGLGAAAAPAPAPEPVPVLILEDTEFPELPTQPVAEDPADLGPGVLTGRVSHAASGAAVAGAVVTVLPEGPTARTSPQGQYFLTGLAGGAFALRVEADRMVSTVVTGDAPRGQLTNFDIVLKPAATEGRIELRIIDSQGKPLTGAEVLVDGRVAGQSAEGGRLGLDNVAPGSHEVTVTRKGNQPATTRVTVAAGATVTETVTLLPEIKPGYLEVKVMNAERQPVAATVTVEGHPELTRKLDPAAGSVALFRLAPGAYRLRVEAPGFQPETQDVQIEEDAEEALRFRLVR